MGRLWTINYATLSLPSWEGDLALAAYYFCYSPYLNILKTFYNTWCSCTCTYKMENFLFILI